MTDQADRFVWVDLEMTGLDPETCAIVEIATIVTNSNLDVIAEGPALVVHQPDEVLAGMNDFVKNLHAKSGLTERVRASTTSLADAERETLAFLEAHVPKGVAPLCGNSVWKDREFLVRYMPRFVQHLHYRIVDVSSIKELARRWYANQPDVTPKKREVHRALDDIRESIEELKHYRARVFR